MTSTSYDGQAVVYCQGAFNTPNGKTAHGLVRRTDRYKVLSVVDAAYAGQDAAEVLDGVNAGIPVYASLADALAGAKSGGAAPTHFVIGLAPDGGRLSAEAREDVKSAISNGLAVDCGLHDFLSDDAEIAELVRNRSVQIRDIRKPPTRDKLHFFSGKIEEVSAFKVAILGTDSAVGKRTTAWMVADALHKAGKSAVFVGTGQTAWMQGAKYSVIFDSLVNDFVSGEIEHAVWSAWNDNRPDFIIIEGQGSLMNPAYPGGFEILAAGRPDAIVMQHAPTRKEYDGFPGYSLHPLTKQIQVLELLSGKPVVAVTVNHEGLERSRIEDVCQGIEQETGLPACDPLWQGCDKVVEILLNFKKEA